MLKSLHDKLPVTRPAVTAVGALSGVCVPVAGRMTQLCCLDSSCQERRAAVVTASVHKLVFRIL